MSDLIRKSQSLDEWKEDFKGFVERLNIPRDDYKGIMEYIDEVPSAEPDLQPTCNQLATDTISRQDAIDAVEFGITYAKAINKSTGEVKELFKEGNKALNEAIERLKELPSAEPRKKGVWIPQNHNKTNGMASTSVYYYPKCSVCGHCANYTNFCPHCGADMRGELDE